MGQSTGVELVTISEFWLGDLETLEFQVLEWESGIQGTGGRKRGEVKTTWTRNCVTPEVTEIEREKRVRR